MSENNCCQYCLSDNVITVRLPSISKPIPLFVLFRALGVESDKEILEYILYDLDNDKSNLQRFFKTKY